VQKADVQPPQAEDAARLLSAAMAEDPELGLFLRLAVMLGARRGELCALRWSDIDFDRHEVLIAGNVVRVPRQALVHKDTKTHAKRRVAVGAGTVELLRARRVTQAKDALAFGTTLAGDAYVFSHAPDGSKPIDPDGISHRFLRLARQLGVQCRLHDLRHLAAALVLWRRAEQASPGGPGRSRNALACICACGRRIRVARSVLELAPILCAACAQPFQPEDDEER
jgi:integrase